jgi:hypothetical protein
VTERLLSEINVNEILDREAETYSGNAIVGRPTLKKVRNGYVQISIPLYYPVNGESLAREGWEALAQSVRNAYNNGLTNLGQLLELRTFTAVWNVRPEWFEPQFVSDLRSGLVDESEKVQYHINVSGLTKSFFQAIGLAKVDFDNPEIVGSIIGFSNRRRKNDPTRLDIARFFPAGFN